MIAHLRSWQQSLQAFSHPRVVTMLFYGIAAGLPLLLIFSSLSLWLREAGVERAAVTYFSWAALGYSFKFIWAPLVDVIPIPLLTRTLGRRRAWLLLSQLMIVLAIVLMAMIDPASQGLTLMALAAVLLGFSAATQDVVIDAYRIESAGPDLQAMMSASYIAGYRIGMLLAGAGALYLASLFGSTADDYSYDAWQLTYIAMAGLMLIGIITTLVIKEPEVNRGETSQRAADYLGLFFTFVVGVSGFIGFFAASGDLVIQLKTILTGWVYNPALASVLIEMLRFILATLVAVLLAKLCLGFDWVNRDLLARSYVEPVQDFFRRYGWSLAWLLLALVGLYRISDIVLGVIANVFYQDMGFTKPQIATVVKTFGLLMTLVGGFLGGILSMRFGVMRILLLGAILSSATNLLFMMLAGMGNEVWMLYVVISADNLSAGLATAAFVAFLSSLTNISFTAVQYAIFSSLMTLLPKVLGGYSGSMVESIGYQGFFLSTALMGLPVLLLVILAAKRFNLEKS
ncbi:MFS transporter [uncultured Methylophaga sp.]|uniref:AmpG family muropeptide MFS transporter n=1 Tax=uncultured Methylophaga sp. TaxID=285271 RepID=UPI0026295541|nr:MFS transporter [uncultured Methylophaga sp.]